MTEVTVCVPTIPGREVDFSRAIQSAQEQDWVLEDSMWNNLQIAGYADHEYKGPAYARNYMVKRADTEWIAFLDDDDYLLSHHISTLVRAQEETDADVIWPWFRVEGGTDPFPQNFGRQWDPEDPFVFPITTLVRRSAFMDVGGFDDWSEAVADPNDPQRWVSGEDWRLWNRLSAAGAKFHHVPEVTWVWRHHGRNSSGLPDRARSLYGR